MHIRELKIRNFRGIAQLDWRPKAGLVVLLGPGDSCKSTVLDAIEFVLAPRWVQFTDVDFANGNPANAITVEATVGGLPASALSDARFGLYVRGWAPNGSINDEPQDDDESVVTIRLTVDAALEPVWELVTDRQQPRIVSQGERRLLGMVRLGEDAERHLGWSQGSALARMTEAGDDAATRLADAYRQARALVGNQAIPGLSAVAETVGREAMQLGAYGHHPFTPGLDTQRASMSLGTLALHQQGVPVRLSGLGSRRLTSLAIQHMSVSEGAIVLIDEVEHGLEPHRILHVLKKLKSMLLAQGGRAAAVGQIFLTTHSAVSVIELAAADLNVTLRNHVRHAIIGAPNTVQPLLRSMPEAFLARKIVVCEGRTEVGLLRAMREHWMTRRGFPPEHCGAVFVDGKGSAAHQTAIALRLLGYQTLLFRDSDVALTPEQLAQTTAAGVQIVEWAGRMATEQRLLTDWPAWNLAGLVAAFYELSSPDSVTSLVARHLGLQQVLPEDFALWMQFAAEPAIRTALAEEAKRGKWIKSINGGERVGQAFVPLMNAGVQGPIVDTIAAIENWVYA